jgi:head-tail adaptor
VLPTSSLSLKQGTLIPVDVTRVDTDSHLQQLVSDEGIWAIVEGILDKALKFAKSEVSTSESIVVEGHQSVPDLTRKDVNVRVKVEGRLEVNTSWVRACSTGDTIVRDVIWVEEVIRCVDPDLDVGTRSCDTASSSG